MVFETIGNRTNLKNFFLDPGQKGKQTENVKSHPKNKHYPSPFANCFKVVAFCALVLLIGTTHTESEKCMMFSDILTCEPSLLAAALKIS